MFGFVKKNFGRGGNTLVLLGLFFGLGLLLHFKEQFFPEGKLKATVEGLVSGTLTEKIDILSDLSQIPPVESSRVLLENGFEWEEVLNRRDFVYPAHDRTLSLQLVEHTGFSLGYNEKYEQAAWVAYLLTKEHITGPGSRERFFNPDPKVRTGSALFSDYTRSGYDRGHLAPAADFKSSQELVKETFYMSNISPQNREFNAGIWNDLEKLLRSWAYHYGKIYVVTGPVLKPGLPTIGKVNKIAVPEQFYKVVLYAKPPYLKGIAFLLNNEPSSQPLSKAVISIDSLEKVTGLEFFPLLPVEVKEKVKMKSNAKEWYRLK